MQYSTAPWTGVHESVTRPAAVSACTSVGAASRLDAGPDLYRYVQICAPFPFKADGFRSRIQTPCSGENARLRERLMLASGSVGGSIFFHSSLDTSSVQVSCLPVASSQINPRQISLRGS